MLNWISELIKLSKEDRVVRFFVRVFVIIIVCFSAFYLVLLGITFWKGFTAKIAGKDFSMQSGNTIRTTQAKAIPIDSHANKTSKDKTHTVKRQKIIYSPTKNDTIKPVLIQSNANGANINGNGNTVAKNVFNGGSGQYSAPIQVGDKLDEPKLIDTEAEAVLESLKKLQNQYKIAGHRMIIYINSDSNLKTYTHQLRAIIESHHYTVDAVNGDGYESFEGIKIEPQRFGKDDINYIITVGSKITDKPFPIITLPSTLQ